MQVTLIRKADTETLGKAAQQVTEQAGQGCWGLLVAGVLSVNLNIKQEQTQSMGRFGSIEKKDG